MMDHAFAYTVALCTHNHADRLERTLADFAMIHPPEAPWEFLIIDNGSRDSTPALLASHKWPRDWTVRVVREEKLGLSNARNRAIAEARGEYLIFIDDDETADSDWLVKFENLIAQRHPDAFGGRIRVLFEGERPTWLTDELLGFLGEVNRFEMAAPLTDPGTSFYGGNFGFRKAVCETVGGFDSMLGRKGSDNTGGEEVDFYRRLLKAGLSVWWMPDAVIYHRIQTEKLRRSYFRDLHYRQGRMEAVCKRNGGSRIPPKHLVGQLARALLATGREFRQGGHKATVRKEMNVAYFVGYLLGWAFGPRP